MKQHQREPKRKKRKMTAWQAEQARLTRNLVNALKRYQEFHARLAK